MSDLQTVIVRQAPILFLARGLGSAEDANAFYDIVAAEFPAPILEPTLRTKAKGDEDRLVNSEGKETEFTKSPANNIGEIVGALKERTDERGGAIFLGTISNIDEVKLVDQFGVKGGISPEHFHEVAAYALENKIEYYPALKNIHDAFTLKEFCPDQKTFKFFPACKKTAEGTITDIYFTPDEVSAFAVQNPDVTISITGGIKTKEEIKDFLRLNYELGCTDNPRIFVGMGIYDGAPAPVADVAAKIVPIKKAMAELEIEFGGQKLGKLVQAKISGLAAPKPNASMIHAI